MQSISLYPMEENVIIWGHNSSRIYTFLPLSLTLSHTHTQLTSGSLKPWTQHATSTTESHWEEGRQPPCMKSGTGGSHLSNTSTSLEVHVTFWQIESKGERWIPRVMQEYSWDTLQTAEHIEYSIPEPELWWNPSMWLWLIFQLIGMKGSKVEKLRG